MARLLTDAELVELARPPRRRFADAVLGDADAEEVFIGITRSFTNFIAGFGSWLDAMGPFLRERHGDDTVGAMAIEAPEVDDARLRLLLAGGADSASILAAYDEIEAIYRDLHDEASDVVAAALSHVYRTYGIDELEAAMRDAGDKTLVAWMPHDEERPPEVRIRHWASMMTGNFAEISIAEDDEAFTISQHPCGTCGRQVARGRYGPGGDLALVTERHPLTFGLGDTPVYRTHVAVMHYLMPIERVGRVWPAITCPERDGIGPCEVKIYKDPSRTPPSYRARVRNAS